jgi:Rab-GTPase-TBC domain
LRPFIWSIFLGVNPQSPTKYISYLGRGPSPLTHKIRNDTPRTLATDPLFQKRVTEGMLRRILNAFDWSMTLRSKDIRYVQGMNVLAAPFLYVCGGEGECMAFGLFEKFITVECPIYLRPTLEGVHRGLKVIHRSREFLIFSYWISVFIGLNQNCIHIYVKRTYRQNSTHSLVLFAMRIMLICSCFDIFSMYATSFRSSPVVGFSTCIRNAHEYPGHRISVDYLAR